MTTYYRDFRYFSEQTLGYRCNIAKPIIVKAASTEMAECEIQSSKSLAINMKLCVISVIRLSKGSGRGGVQYKKGVRKLFIC